MLNTFVFYAPNFEEVEGDWVYSSVRLSVRPSVTLAYGEECFELEILYIAAACKISGPVFFRLSVGLFFFFFFFFFFRVIPLFFPLRHLTTDGVW